MLLLTPSSSIQRYSKQVPISHNVLPGGIQATPNVSLQTLLRLRVLVITYSA